MQPRYPHPLRAASSTRSQHLQSATKTTWYPSTIAPIQPPSAPAPTYPSLPARARAQLRPLHSPRDPTPLVLLPVGGVAHIGRDQDAYDDDIAKHKAHEPAHEVENTADQVLREAEDGLDGGEDAVEDAAEDFEEGGEEVGDSGGEGGHACLGCLGCLGRLL